jgi:hypothetical protein
VNHVICVIADHPAIVYLAGDLAANTRRRRRQWRLGVVLVLVVLIIVGAGGGGGHNGRPVVVPVGVAEVASAPV